MPGPYAVGCFDDQFDSVGGDHTAFEYSLIAPFDCVLQRASAIAFAASAGDAYLTVELNDEEIVDQADGLSVGTSIDFIVLDSIVVQKGDKITVKLHLVASNVVKRCKTVLAYAAQVDRDVVAPGYYPTYAYA